MYDVSAKGVDEHMINVHYYYYYIHLLFVTIPGKQRSKLSHTAELLYIKYLDLIVFWHVCI